MRLTVAYIRHLNTALTTKSIVPWILQNEIGIKDEGAELDTKERVNLSSKSYVLITLTQNRTF